MIDIKAHNETSLLEVVVLGVPNDFGGEPDLDECYDPKSKQNIINGTFPSQEDISLEMNEFANILTRYGIKVLRPHNIKGLNQIFARDICFVVGDKFIVPNIIQERKKELEAMSDILNNINKSSIISMPEDTRAEGGDVLLFNQYLFVGYSENNDFDKYNVSRTNKQGVQFLESCFPEKKVMSFELNKSDTNPRENALHLDCCFQPIGRDMAIIHKEGFKNPRDVNFLVNLFGKGNIIFIDKEEMYDMNANIFSVSEEVVISEKRFTRLNNQLHNKGFIVEAINYSEISKMEGLLRCSTMPLRRI